MARRLSKIIWQRVRSKHTGGTETQSREKMELKGTKCGSVRIFGGSGDGVWVQRPEGVEGREGSRG